MTRWWSWLGAAEGTYTVVSKFLKEIGLMSRDEIVPTYRIPLMVRPVLDL